VVDFRGKCHSDWGKFLQQAYTKPRRTVGDKVRIVTIDGESGLDLISFKTLEFSRDYPGECWARQILDPKGKVFKMGLKKVRPVRHPITDPFHDSFDLSTAKTGEQVKTVKHENTKKKQTQNTGGKDSKARVGDRVTYDTIECVCLYVCASVVCT